MSTRAAAIPATANSQNASCVRTISCPCALNVNIAAELTTRVTAAITIAPRAALILVALSFKQMVHVPEEAVKRHFRLSCVAQSLVQQAPVSGSTSERFAFAKGKQTFRQRCHTIVR